MKSVTCCIRVDNVDRYTGTDPICALAGLSGNEAEIYVKGYVNPVACYVKVPCGAGQFTWVSAIPCKVDGLLGRKKV